MKARTAALAAIVATTLFWGLSFVSIKVAVAVFPPMSLGALRFALSVAVLWAVKRATAPAEKLRLRDLPYLAGAGLVGVTCYFFFENNGVLLVSASEASIIIAAIPVLTMAAEAAAARLRRRTGTAVGPRRWAGAVLSVAGVYLVAGASVSVSGSAAGYLYMLGAAVSWVAYCFLTRPLFDSRSRIYIVFWQSVFGLAGFLPFAAAELPRWGSPSAAVVAHVAYLGVFCSALGYWFYARALQVLGLGTATIFVNLIPVVTCAAGYLFLGERLAPVQWAGAALVLGGVYLATAEGRRAAAATTRS